MLRSILLAATLLSSVSIPLAAVAQGIAGPYLSARVAGFNNDYRAAGEGYADLLAAGETGPQILENALIIYSVLGDFEAATEVADTLDEIEQQSQFASSARMVTALRDGRHDDALALLDAGGVAGPLLDGLLRAWVLADAGDVEAGLAAFDTLAETEAFVPYALRQKAYLLALQGDMEEADLIMSGQSDGGPLTATERGIAAHAQVLMELDRADDALELVQKANEVTSSAMLRDLQARIEAGEEVVFDMIRNPRDGLAEAYFVFSALLAGDSSMTFTLLNARAAITLRPTHVEALMLASQLLEAQDQLDLAAGVLDAVDEEDPAYFEVKIARADLLMATDESDKALELLTQLTETDPGEVEVWASLADALRRLDRFAESAEAYDRAIALLPEVTERNWILFYARGIARERDGDWPGAEEDFRRALELNPGNANVLNYLGYGLVEQRMKLDEALKMIQQAVAARPDDGYITDSLAWVYYRLGRYEDAVEPMERAVMLMPLDPLINDHLGDVLWKVGRKREARFQWRRALSFDPEEEVDRIRRKLEVGLDVVLEEEGGVGPIQATD